MCLLRDEIEEFRTLLKVVESVGTAMLTAKTVRERKVLKDDFDVAMAEVEDLMTEILYREEKEEIIKWYEEFDPQNSYGLEVALEQCYHDYFGDDEEE